MQKQPSAMKCDVLYFLRKIVPQNGIKKGKKFQTSFFFALRIYNNIQEHHNTLFERENL